jgi:hypothetical protein
MAPQAVTSPTRRFVLTRLDSGVETNVAISTLLPNNYASDQAVRATTYTNARTLRGANPGVVYILYGPTNGGAHTDGDRIWRSDVSD